MAAEKFESNVYQLCFRCKDNWNVYSYKTKDVEFK